MASARDALFFSVVVRRVGVGSTPFTWAIQRTDVDALIHMSTDRFRTMDAAYRAGQANLAKFVHRRLAPSRLGRPVRRPEAGLGPIELTM